MSRRQTKAAKILAAEPLVSLDFQGDLTRCNICGDPSGELGVWRAHDENDRPIESQGALAFIGKDHPECLRRLDQHPRLYAEETGKPGHLPRLCGDCRHRSGFDCSHAKLKKNGGSGLYITLSGAGIALRRAGVMCMKGGRVGPNHAEACEGKESRT